MIERVVTRLGTAVVTVLGVSALVFGITSTIPTDPTVAFAGRQVDKETRLRIRRELGLEDPIGKQYIRYIVRVARGDLGRSYVTREPVASTILTRLPATAGLALGVLAFWVLVGVPVGVLTAKCRGRWPDRTVLFLATLSLSLPIFWFGRLLQFGLAYQAGVLPVAGFVSWQHLVLPSLALGISGVGYYSRLIHAHMVEVLSQDYVLAARARGIPEQIILFNHALRNAVLPVLTALGLDTAALLGGVVFVESVFALPGLGSLALQAVLTLDVPMIMGVVLFSAILVIGVNMLVDGVNQLVDPRVRLN